MKSIIKLNEKKLKTIPGTFLYKNKNDYFFYENKEHSIFLRKNSDNFEQEKNKDLWLNIEKYMLDFLEACNHAEQKPSIIIHNGYTTKDQMDLDNIYESLCEVEEATKLLEKPSIYFSASTQELRDVINQILPIRNNEMDQNYSFKQDLFLFLFLPDNENIEYLNTLLTVSKSRHIYINLVILDEAAYNENYDKVSREILESLCNVKFNCNEKNILSFEIPSIKNKKFEYKSNINN